MTPKIGLICSKITNWRQVVGANRAQMGINPGVKGVEVEWLLWLLCVTRGIEGVKERCKACWRVRR